MHDDISFSRIPEEVLTRWRTVRDVLSGDQAVRDGDYLPHLNSFDQSAENVARNGAYRTRAVWYPATQYTLDGLLGMAFRVDPTLELPPALKYMEKNCDGAGTSLYQQAQETLTNILGPGRHGLYVDYSDAMKGPVFKAYHAENIINWKYRNVDGEMVLTLVVLEENVEVEDGQYSLKLVKQWRELFLDQGKFKVRLWMQNPDDIKKPPMQKELRQADGKMVMELEIRSQTETFDFIPFVFVGSQKNNGSIIGPSPLYGLAVLNLAHFRNSADHEDSVFYCGQAQPWMSGLDIEWRNWMMAPTTLDENGVPRFTGQRMYVGSRAPLMLPQGAQFGYASPEPNGMVVEAMKHKEAQMVAVGARVIEPSLTGGRTATEDENDKDTSTSVLSLCVANVNEAYQQCITWAMRWKGTKDFDASEVFKITQEFIGKRIDPAVLTAMVASWQTGITAKNDVREYMRQVGLLPSDRDDNAIDRDIESEPPRPGTTGLEDEDPAGTPPGKKPPAAPAPKPQE